jgi:hypothetical protein
MRKNTSLNELMGKSGSKAERKDLSLNDLQDILGERMPKIEFSPVGRLRLTQALRKRFGDDFRNLPGIEGILKEFDEESKFSVKLQEMKMIKGQK